MMLESSNALQFKRGSNLHIALNSTSLFYRSIPTFVYDFSNELKWWVFLRSIVWFSHFILTKFDSQQWVKLFQMTKHTLFDIVVKLRLYMESKILGTLRLNLQKCVWHVQFTNSYKELIYRSLCQGLCCWFSYSQFGLLRISFDCEHYFQRFHFMVHWDKMNVVM